MPFCELRYGSDALIKDSAVNILLPSPSLEPPFHVMFLLHGLSDDNSSWCRNSSIERYMRDIPMIVVMPDGGRSFYCDADQGFPYAQAIGVELPQIIRKYFPTREQWCVAGLSMGGYGALKLAFSHPELFISTHSLSGAVGFGNRSEYLGDDRAPEFKRILGEESLGGPNDLYALAAALEPSKRPKVRIDCGVDDYLIEDNRLLHAHLEGLGFSHEYEEFEGAHTWDYWDRHIQDAIHFHCNNLGIPTDSNS